MATTAACAVSLIHPEMPSQTKHFIEQPSDLHYVFAVSQVYARVIPRRCACSAGLMTVAWIMAIRTVAWRPRRSRFSCLELLVMKSTISLCLVLAICPVCRAGKNANVASVLVERGEVVFADGFDRSELGAEWSRIRGEWKIVDGEINGKEIKADKHAAVFHCLKKNRNSVVRFSFRLNGAKEFHFSLNHAKGHLFRVVVSPDSVILRTDADKKDKTINSEALAKAAVKFEQGKWYTMQIEMVGDKVAVSTDNGLKLTGQNARLDVDKPNYRFILKEEYLQIDDFTVWSIK